MIEQTSIREIKGIGEKTAKLFGKIGIFTVGDLIHYYPRTYDIYEKVVPISELEAGKIQAITGGIQGNVSLGGNPQMQVVTCQVRDLTGTVKAVWFRTPYVRSQLSGKARVTLRGRVVKKNNRLELEQAEIFLPSDKYKEKLDTLQPIYGLTAGLSNNALMKAMRQSLSQLDLSRDYLPGEVSASLELMDLGSALKEIHFPKEKKTFYRARNRLVFDEFLEFLFLLRKLKTTNDVAKNQYPMKPESLVDQFLKKLPFALTAAQKNVWNDILKDFAGTKAMSRLVQGDVGSGKTIMAVLALLTVAANGYQGALMAPTEVLARQHYESIMSLFKEHGISFPVELLTGSMTKAEKRRAYDRIACGYSKIIVGTHALIQEAVTYDALALVVTDEQHRFGVNQRKIFAEKGGTPHVLVMSATPIPRTLAIILYGDLDISVIDELPANRLPIKNCVVDDHYRKTAYEFMKKQVAEGRQCYVICPMVEENEKLEAENVIDYAKILQEEMGLDICVEYLHGRMKQNLKDDIMSRFGKNEIQILVSTTVIEVGIDVPNATVMLIENAERFGLAQLHQLRGRVGRGKYQSYCIFMSNAKNKETRERLEILNKSNDGFKISSEDLRLRGPGDLFGIRQSGLMDFKLGDIYQDAKILQKANEACDRLLEAGYVLEDLFPNSAHKEDVIL